jgi:hypothetical protein
MRIDFTMTPLTLAKRPRPVQLVGERGVGQRASPLGVPPGQRADRRLQRGAQHAGAQRSALSTRAFVVKVNRLFRF